MALPSSGSLSFSAIYFELTGSNPESGTPMSKLFNGEFAPINPNSQSQPSSSTPYSLNSFHGYDQTATGLTSFWYANVSGIGSGCFIECDTEAWHNGAGALPTVGDVVYTDSGGNNYMWPSFPGPWRGMNETQSQPSNFRFTINQKAGNGVVGVVESCEE